MTSLTNCQSSNVERVKTSSVNKRRKQGLKFVAPLFHIVFKNDFNSWADLGGLPMIETIDADNSKRLDLCIHTDPLK
jgi:hypothetical protein